ncbi:uncharacterized protein LOC110761954 [Prunus avium]|uniref:Uncharacterized protein LOC110761954 n=1 Tax=Prunus avium TaxID=42229 RepID=A0A6P5T1Q5_PRUAV|nr:uncharacterized protein LOC110761954 [Prunus avium]
MDVGTTMRAGEKILRDAKKNTRGPCRQLSTAKLTRVTNSRINIRYDERHRAAPTADQHSSLAHDVGSVIRTHCPMKWKSWKAMPNEVQMEVRGQLSINYNLENLNDDLFGYINRLFADRYKQWKSNLHHHFQAYDDPQVALLEGCPKELEGREDSWEWLCANKGNRAKKTLLHHSGARPFSYRMEARRQEGSKFPEIDVFGDVYVRPGNELAESIHMTMIEKSQLVLQESASQLPPDTPLESVAPPPDAGFQILTEALEQTLGRRPGTYCRGMGNARRREPRSRSSSQSNSAMTAMMAQFEARMSQMDQLQARVAQMAELEAKVAQMGEHEARMSQMDSFLQSLAQSGIPVPSFVPSSTSEPIQPEHGHQTSAPVDNVQIGDQVDYQTMFD